MCRVGDLFSPLHLVIVLAILLVIFGPRRLPELGSGLGKAISGFRKATTEPTIEQTVVEATAEAPQRGGQSERNSDPTAV
jgi:sec-independent protein translocase protein TatA